MQIYSYGEIFVRNFRKDGKMTDLTIQLQMLQERFKSKAEKAYITALDDAMTIILGKLARIESVDEIKRLNALKTLIEKEISGLYEDIKPYVKEDMTDFAQFDYKTQFNFINDTAKLGYTFAALPKDTIKQVINFDGVLLLSGKRYTLNELFDNVGYAQIEKYKQIISGGLAANDGYSNIAKSLKEAGAEATLNMRSLVQTAIGEARDRANIYTYDEVFADVIIGWKSVATLDSRTSYQCAALDGQKYMKPKYSYSTIPNRPPRHFNCRSKLRPITTMDTVTERPENGDETGQVKSNVKFEQWFPTQSEKFQKEYLGEARYKLYKEERLSIKSFVDVKDGKLFTIKEIKEMLT